jgi:hypothetical protein
MKFNFSTALALLGCLGVFAPDIASVASMLSGLGVSWLTPVVRGLGLLAAFCAAAPLIVPKLRPMLALLGLATPPGAIAPWQPGRPGDPNLTAPQDSTGPAVSLKIVQAAPLPSNDPDAVTIPITTKGNRTP